MYQLVIYDEFGAILKQITGFSTPYEVIIFMCTKVKLVLKTNYGSDNGVKRVPTHWELTTTRKDGA